MLKIERKACFPEDAASTAQTLANIEIKNYNVKKAPSFYYILLTIPMISTGGHVIIQETN